jgi:FAD/FMN-containing dehydrogenase
VFSLSIINIYYESQKQKYKSDIRKTSLISNLEEILVLAVTHSVLYKKLEGIVGSGNLTDKELIVEAYTTSTTGRFSVGMQEMLEAKKPGFIVRPGSKEQIQEIVRLANQYKVPIIPVGAMTSAYYETVPTLGCIMLDFSRMKKIEIDEESMTITLEPGVVWAQAYRDLAVKGYWVSAQASPASVSIVGTTSQSGTHMPYDKYPTVFAGFYSDLTLGLEVVLPTGELLVTGSAALPGAKPHVERAYGPGVAHIFLAAQGTLGIVVKQTLPLFRIPEVRHIVTGLFTHENYGGLSRALQKIMYEQFEGPVWIERLSAFYDGTKRQEWELYVQLYGRKAIVEALRKFSEEIILKEGGTLCSTPRILEPEDTESPQMYEEWIFWRPRANSIISPLLDVAIGPAGQESAPIGGIGGVAPYQKMPELYAAMLKLFAKHGIPISRIRRGMAQVNTRSATKQSTLLSYYYDPKDPEEVKRAKAINEEWSQIYAKITGEKYTGALSFGPIPYRFSPSLAKTAMPRLGEYYKLLVKLKRMLDPNRIMNPGKLMDIEPY